MIWLLLVVAAPAIAAGLVALYGSHAKIIGLIGTVGSLLSAVFLLRSGTEEIYFPGLPGLAVRLSADLQTTTISVIVALVASIIVLYATGYFTGRPERRFYVTVSAFIAAMQLFIVSADFIVLLVAWELMAATSLLLIGHDTASNRSGRAATRAFMTTRAGDIGLYLAIFMVIAGTGSSSLAALGELPAGSATVAGVLLTIAAAAKAAQIPFGGWLRDAMAGPTPVSALLHSATMVAAGVLLLVKVSPWLTQDTMQLIALIGGLTAVVAGTIAAVQVDFKRLLAASTSSQLGLMFLAVGAGVPAAALLHFTANAFMKSSLFLGAGVFQHERSGTSFKQLAGVAGNRRNSFYATALAGLALAGLPPLAGFWSKDTILAAAEHSSVWLFGLALAATLLTGVYIASALRKLWLGDRKQTTKMHGTRTMDASLALLTLAILGYGLVVKPLEAAFGQAPTSVLSAILGTTVAAAGLFAGWRYDTSGKLQQNILHVSLSQGLERVALSFSSAVTSIVSASEKRFDTVVISAGAGSMRIAEAVRKTEDPAIEGLYQFGTYLRGVSRRIMLRLQTGLVHQQLAVSLSVTFSIGVMIAVLTLILTGGKP